MKGAERWAGHGPPVGLTALGQEAVQTLKPVSASARLRRGAGVGDQAEIMGRWDLPRRAVLDCGKLAGRGRRGLAHGLVPTPCPAVALLKASNDAGGLDFMPLDPLRLCPRFDPLISGKGPRVSGFFVRPKGKRPVLVIKRGQHVDGVANAHDQRLTPVAQVVLQRAEAFSNKAPLTR